MCAKYTIHDWFGFHVDWRAKYVALSRATSKANVQIAGRKEKPLQIETILLEILAKFDLETNTMRDIKKEIRARHSVDWAANKLFIKKFVYDYVLRLVWRKKM